MKFLRVEVGIQKLLASARPSETTVVMLLAIFVGGLAGTVVVLYHFLIEIVNDYAYTIAPQRTWLSVIFCALGGLIGGVILLRVRSARGSGVNQVRVSLIVHDAYVPLRGTIGKFFASGIGIGLGLPLGPEDPAIHIGGGIASAMGRLFSLSKKNLQQLIPVGAAAGLAAAFNTPITAVIFTLEEVVGNINAPILGSTVVAAVVAVMVRRAALGGEPLFTVPKYEFGAAGELFLYVALGLMGGLVSAGFTRMLVGLRSWAGQIPRRGYVDYVTIGGGAIAGGLAIISPQILGAGYDVVNSALNGQLAFEVLLLALLFKLLGTSIAFSTGNSGGLFAPSLFLGAMLGGAMGTLARAHFGHDVADVGAYALVGMGVTFAGIIRAPITSIFMIFEVTQDYQIMLPLMIANIISYAVARTLHPGSLFDLLARQDGIHLPNKEHEDLNDLTVEAAMRPRRVVLDPKMTAKRALEEASRAQQQAFAIAGPEQELYGVVTTPILTRAVAAGEGERQLYDLAVSAGGYRIYPDQPLTAALEKLGGGAMLLPVVGRLHPDILMGVVDAEDVLRVYG
ncbi:MAG TPA: chloride channel protein, partial [Candidatus Koribacter sp.]